MSSFTGYNRRPVTSNAGYYPNEYQSQYPYNYGDRYAQDSISAYPERLGRYPRGQNNYDYTDYNTYNNAYNTYDPQLDYEDDHTRPYGPRRRNSYTGTPYYPDSSSAVTYSNVIPSAGQYIEDGGYRPTRSSRRRRHRPLVLSGSGTAIARPAVQYLGSSSSNSGYQAHGERGERIPISNGLSYFEEGISLSTWIRRLFGLGPRRSRNHVGQSVHVKRWDIGRSWNSVMTRKTNASVYTL